MKAPTLSLLISLSVAAIPCILPAQAAGTISVSTSVHTDSHEELDSLLAPVALYPDTVLTHVLIASTYPLDVVAAWRWQQNHQHLSDTQIEAAMSGYHWDPSVKALLLFSDVLGIMAQDLDWLQALGNHVVTDQAYVLGRVQLLRDKALRAGYLSNNSYQHVSHSHKTIVITSVRPHTVYVPFYDTRRVYGAWWHHRAPVYWHHPGHYRRAGSLYYSPGIRFSASFDFGAIHWRNRYVVVNRQPVRRYHSPVKRVRSSDYQRWEHKHRTPVKVVRSTERGARHISTLSRQQLTPLPGQRVVKSRHNSTVRRFDNKPVKQPVIINKTRQEKPAYTQRQQTMTRQGDRLRRTEQRQVKHRTSSTARQQGSAHRDGRTINR